MADKLQSQQIRPVRQLLARFQQFEHAKTDPLGGLNEALWLQWAQRFNRDLPLCDFHPFGVLPDVKVAAYQTEENAAHNGDHSIREYFHTLTELVRTAEKSLQVAGHREQSSTGHSTAFHTEKSSANTSPAVREVARKTMAHAAPHATQVGMKLAAFSSAEKRSLIESTVPVQQHPTTAIDHPQDAAGSLYSASTFQQLQSLVDALEVRSPAPNQNAHPVQYTQPVTGTPAASVPNQLQQLTQKLFVTSAANSTSRATGQERSTIRQSNRISAPREVEMPARNLSSPVASSIATLPRDPLSRWITQSSGSNQQTSAPLSTVQVRPAPLFQDAGGLEVQTVADALNDYLQEQASLHGVDLS